MAKKRTKKNVQVYTVDERIRRVWDAENIKDLMARRSFYLANDQRREELNALWVAKPEHRESASFGSNWGYYVGMDAISNYYVVRHDYERKAQLAGYCAAHPEVENRLENQGYGCYVCRPMSTPLVVISGDGETAKGIWYSIGVDCAASGEGEAECRWFNDKVAADFVKEDGEWKIWHLVVSNDLSVRAGENADDLPTIIPVEDNPAAIEFGTPDIPMLTHDGSLNWSDDYPFLPQEYFRFSDEVSYGPEGHPDYEG